jgi:hypothetical protein
MILFRPRFDKRLRDAVDLYSTDDLRRLYQLESSEVIQIRNALIEHSELREEILWRVV